ncbi:MAG TPA: EamA family transporter [Patescibacteria group bacterium]|nr:EamA family transporter [Patescibacteria group bacterium]
MDFLLNNWLLIAFIAPFFWAFANIIDACFVEEVYKNEYDGTVITGFMQIIPWLTVPFIGLTIPDVKITLLAITAGFLVISSYFFYFKALFVTRDATLILILWNVVAIIVPVLSFFFLNEKLTLLQYSGIFLIFLAALHLTSDKKIKKENVKKVILLMAGTTILWSLSLVASREVYLKASFYSGMMFFSLGSIMAGTIFYLLRKRKRNNISLSNIQKKYFKWIFLEEILTLFGLIASQRAINLSPAVAFVAVIESIQPAFIVMSSATAFFLLSLFSFRKIKIMEKIRNDQLIGIGSKAFAIIAMAIGIYMINI